MPLLSFSPAHLPLSCCPTSSSPLPYTCLSDSRLSSISVRPCHSPLIVPRQGFSWLAQLLLAGWALSLQLPWTYSSQMSVWLRRKWSSYQKINSTTPGEVVSPLLFFFPHSELSQLAAHKDLCCTSIRSFRARAAGEREDSERKGVKWAEGEKRGGWGRLSLSPHKLSSISFALWVQGDGYAGPVDRGRGGELLNVFRNKVNFHVKAQ